MVFCHSEMTKFVDVEVSTLIAEICSCESQDERKSRSTALVDEFKSVTEQQELIISKEQQQKPIIVIIVTRLGLSICQTDKQTLTP